MLANQPGMASHNEAHMKFILLNRIDEKQVLVNVTSIISLQVEDETTWVHLVDGTKFMVSDYADHILTGMGASQTEPSDL